MKGHTFVVFALLGFLLLTGPTWAQSAYIPNVPDANQPPTNTLGISDTSNFCAPMSAVNISVYWDSVIGHPNAVGVNAGLGVKTAAEYIGYFMDTNDLGSSSRENGTTQPSSPGTYTADQRPGFYEFAHWDAAHMFTTPPPGLPAGKKGFHWQMEYLDNTTVTPGVGFDFCAAKIDSGGPVKIDFIYWNPILTTVVVTDSASGDSIYFHDWGSTVTGSSDPEHEEDWNFAPGEEGIGHAVTGVGYFRNIDPDNGGPLPYGDYIVVHDNWYDTPENVAICWNNWLAAISADPRFAVAVAEPVDLEPYFDWGAISSYSGLVPPGFMGIWSPSHTTNLYFPSDSLAPFTSSPKAWLDPGDHVLTRYAPSHVRIDSCPVKDAIITVPDRFDRPCSVLVEIPRANLIDEATDSNVIQISSSETKCITIGEYTELVVFLANCDGGVTRPEWPDTSQHLGVIINYADSTVDSLIFADIHPAARLDITDPNWPPSWIFVYGNEVLVSAPPYFDSPFGFDEYHSEVWHWYTLLPDPDVLVDSLVFIGMQPVEPNNEIYILALSYQGGASSGIYGEDEAPSHLGRARLFQNRPNPFCLTTGIRYALSRDCWVRLEIYNVLGERVAVLVDGQEKAGYRTATLDAGSLSSGIYFCRLNAGHQIETMKMILLK